MSIAVLFSGSYPFCIPQTPLIFSCISTPSAVRGYKTADADLIQQADALQISVLRDAAYFATRNASAEALNELEKARDAFANFQTDPELQGAVTVQVEAKDAKRRDVEERVRTVRGTAETPWGTASGQYRSFGFGRLTQLFDNGLHRTARRVARMAGDKQGELAEQGLMAEHIAGLTSAAEVFDDAIDSVEAASRERDIRTQERIRLGNAVFARVMRLAQIGKSLYQDKDEAKHNDYIIRDTPPPAAPTAIGA